jgi:cysteinyl-tRNA synthetase
VNAEKMSKSTGNFMLLKDVLEEYEAAVVRLMMLQTHYRSPLDFSTDRLDEAVSAYERLKTLVRNVRWARGTTPMDPGAPEEERQALRGWVDEARKRFSAEMDDDFNTAGALAAVFELARASNTFLAHHQGAMSVDDFKVLANAEDTMVELLEVLGIEIDVAEKAGGGGYPREVVDLAVSLAGYVGSDPGAAVEALLAARSVARSDKNWAAADAVRDGLADLGFVIEDTASGARVAYVSRG